MENNNHNVNTILGRYLTNEECEADDILLDVLFEHFCECSHRERAESQKLSKELRRHLLEVVPDHADQLMNMVYRVCFQNEREGFYGGVKTGFKLTIELQK